MTVTWKGTCSLLLCLLTLLQPARAQEAQPQESVGRHALMPVPASVRILGGRMKVEPTFTVAFQGHTDARLAAGVERALRRLERRTGLEFPRAAAEAPAAANLVLQTGGPGRGVPALEEDESYALEVSERQAFINAPTAVGCLRGLETFLQLLSADASGYYFPEARVRRSPRGRQPRPANRRAGAVRALARRGRVLRARSLRAPGVHQRADGRRRPARP